MEEEPLHHEPGRAPRGSLGGVLRLLRRGLSGAGTEPGAEEAPGPNSR